MTRSLPPLAAEDVLVLWDTGRHLPAVERTHALLRAALPGHAPEALDSLMIGEQHSALVQLLAGTFGETLDVVATCGGCGELLEIPLDLSALLSQTPDSARLETEVTAEEYTLRIRPLTGADVRAAAACHDAASARRLLGERAVLSAHLAGEPLPAAHLPDRVLTRVGEAIGALDPSAEFLLDLNCPSCGNSVSPVLDPGGLLWAEISGLAMRLLREVHALASAYGWSEGEILRLSTNRRAAYLGTLEA